MNPNPGVRERLKFELDTLASELQPHIGKLELSGEPEKFAFIIFPTPDLELDVSIPFDIY